jgi:threonine/homoserine/homoserine lactone efflux protein
VVVVVSFVVYSAYMVIAFRAGRLLMSGNTAKRLHQTTGVMLVGSGLVAASR